MSASAPETGPRGSDRRSGGRRVVIFAAIFSLLAHGCFIVVTSLTRSPF